MPLAGTLSDHDARSAPVATGLTGSPSTKPQPSRFQSVCKIHRNKLTCLMLRRFTKDDSDSLLVTKIFEKITIP